MKNYKERRIRNLNELHFFIEADRIMNGWGNNNIKNWIKNLFFPNYISMFLEHLRCCEYYQDKNTILYAYHKYRMNKLQYKLGFSIAMHVLGYGCVIPHHGTIVVGKGNYIGNFCVLHTGICINEGKKIIGDAFYVSTGVKVIKDINIEDNVSCSANSVVNSSFENGNITIAGAPAINKKILRHGMFVMVQFMKKE